MIVKTLDGKTYDWTISEKISKGNKRKTSGLHKTARGFLREKYSNVDIYEEVPIIVEKGTKLFLDFYLPVFNLAIEVNGSQHYVFSSMFHKNQLEFLKSVTNDGKKSMWCEINDIQLVTLKYNEVDKWPTLI
jgi:hypothetical protein